MVRRKRLRKSVLAIVMALCLLCGTVQTSTVVYATGDSDSVTVQTGDIADEVDSEESQDQETSNADGEEDVDSADTQNDDSEKAEDDVDGAADDDLTEDEGLDEQGEVQQSEAEEAADDLDGNDSEAAEEASEETSAITLTYVQGLINSLPDADSITSENAADVEALLDAIDAAKLSLTDEEKDTGLNYTKYDAAVAALELLAGGTVSALSLTAAADELTDDSLLWSTLTNPTEDETGDVTLTVVTTEGNTETYQYATIMNAVIKLFSYMNHGDNYQTTTSYSATTSWYCPNGRGYNWSGVDYTWDYVSAEISFTEEHCEYINTIVQFKSSTSGWVYAGLPNVTFNGNGTGSIVGETADSWDGETWTTVMGWGYSYYMSNMEGTLVIGGDGCTVKNIEFTGNHEWCFGYYCYDQAIRVSNGASNLSVENNTFQGYTLVTNFGEDNQTVSGITFKNNTIQNCLYGLITSDKGVTDLTFTGNTLIGSADSTLTSCLEWTNLLDFSGNTLIYASFGLRNGSESMQQYLDQNTYDHGFLFDDTIVGHGEEGSTEWYYAACTTTVMTVLPEGVSKAVWTSDYNTAGYATNYITMPSTLTYTQQDAINDAYETADDPTYAILTWTSNVNENGELITESNAVANGYSLETDSNGKTYIVDSEGNLLHTGIGIGKNYSSMHLDYAYDGSLTVEKDIVYGNSSKEFDFTVEIDTSTCSTSETVSGVYGTVVNADGTEDEEVEFTVDAENAKKSTATFTLSDGESVTFENLPVGATYTVTETSAANYTATIEATDEEARIDGNSVTGTVLSDGTTISYTNTYSSPSSGSSADFDISKSKEATNLDENYESDVTISLPSASYTGDLDVAFVLDGSTSHDNTNLAEAAAALLDELVGYENLTVKVSITVFGGYNPILETTELLELTEENVEYLKDFLTTDYKSMDGRSGSNLQAGVEKARALLNADTAVDGSDKYMIILTDGGARMWYDSESGEAMSDGYAYGTSVWWNSNEDWCNRYGVTGSESYISETAPTFESVWEEGQNGADIGAYGLTYSQWQSAVNGDTSISYASWDTAMHADDYYTTYEAACYYAATSIIAASQEVNVCMVTYQYYSDTTYTIFTEQFKTWLENYVTRYDIAQVENIDEETAAQVFAAVRDQLIQLVDAGSVVVDEIGDTDDYDFDFINDIDRLTLTVDGEALDVTQIDEYTYGFGADSSLAAGYQFVLTYYPDGTTYSGTEYNECYVLEINVPITKDKAVKLTYGVVLTNPQTESGTYGEYDQYGDNNDGSENYGLYTNNVARLYPVDSNGNSLPPEEFQKPAVSYEITNTYTPADSSETEDTQDDSDDSTQTQESVVDPVQTQDAKTGDNTNITLYLVLMIATAAAIMILTVAYSRKKRN